MTRPTDIDRFGDRDMTKWSTLYGLEGQSEDGFDLNHASWPVAAVASDYEFGKTFDFGGMTFTLEDTYNKGYLQLYVQIPNGSNGKWSHTMSNPTSKKALFLYFGDNENPTYLANGVSAMWPVIEFVENTPTPIAQYGANNDEQTPTPTEIRTCNFPICPVKDAYIGTGTEIVIDDNDDLWVYGAPAYGHYIEPGSQPTKIDSNVREVTGTMSSVFYIKNTNELYGFGRNSYGQLGNDVGDAVYTPRLIQANATSFN